MGSNVFLSSRRLLGWSVRVENERERERENIGMKRERGFCRSNGCALQSYNCIFQRPDGLLRASW